MDYNAMNVPLSTGRNDNAAMTVDKFCKLLKSAQPLVWAIAIVFVLLGVTLTIHYLWRLQRTPEKQHSSVENIWLQT